MMRERIRVLNKVPEINLAEVSLGPFDVGDEAEVWPWEAKILERHGLAESSKISSTDIRQRIIAEERSQDLEAIPENFYFLARKEVANLKKAGEKEKADDLKSWTLALLEIRLPKLLKLVQSPESSGNVPLEEKFFVNRLAFITKVWSQKLERFLEAGEEVD